MLFKDYLDNFTHFIHEYTQLGFILSFEINTDFRTENIGFIKGKIYFIDNSVLFFTEYLDLRFYLDKKSYSFHYQDQKNNLIFRYDNALHKPALEFQHHKHIDNKIICSNMPNIENILEEIQFYLL